MTLRWSCNLDIADIWSGIDTGVFPHPSRLHVTDTGSALLKAPNKADDEASSLGVDTTASGETREARMEAGGKDLTKTRVEDPRPRVSWCSGKSRRYASVISLLISKEVEHDHRGSIESMYFGSLGA